MGRKKTEERQRPVIRDLWIGREEIVYGQDDYVPDDIPDNEGRLFLFYDRPVEFRDGEFKGVRKMAELPGYMCPDIKDGEVAIFTKIPFDNETYSFEKLTEDLRLVRELRRL